jgi:tripartite-type tricarboxylate transporter receptor subunit TctC
MDVRRIAGVAGHRPSGETAAAHTREDKMQHSFRTGARACLFAAALSVAPAAGAARADAVADFYKDKTITVLCPFGAAGGYGMVVRSLAEYMPRYLPGKPRAVPQFMPGGGGLKQANYTYNVAPKDGAVIALMYDNMPTAQTVQPERGVKFDARLFGVLGSISHGEVGVFGVFKSTGIVSMADAKAKQAALGSTGTSSAQYIVPNVANKLIGTNFRLVPGYKSTGELFLALERGELTGLFSNYATFVQMRPGWISEKKMNFLAQLADRRSADFPNVPLLQELVSDPVEKGVFELLSKSRIPGKITIAPPGVPEARLAALRAAFAKTMADPGFKAEMAKINQAVDPRPWQEALQIITDTVETSQDVVDRVRALTARKKK